MNKYRNEPIWIDGIRFSSIKEGNRYQELKLLQRAGEISHLARQVSFELIPAVRKHDGTLQRSTRYIADFVYMDNRTRQRVVEDVKGYRAGAAYEMFKIKKKLMLWVHGIEIKEV